MPNAMVLSNIRTKQDAIEFIKAQTATSNPVTDACKTNYEVKNIMLSSAASGNKAAMQVLDKNDQVIAGHRVKVEEARKFDSKELKQTHSNSFAPPTLTR